LNDLLLTRWKDGMSYNEVDFDQVRATARLPAR
jgi:hypothetical protein